MLNKTLKINNLLIAFYFLVIIALMVLPILKFSVKYVYIIAFSVPFVGLYIMQKRRNLSVLYLFIGALAFLFILSFLFNMQLNFSASMNLSIISYLCFLPYFMFDFTVSRNNKPEMKLILIFALLLFAFIMIRTFIEFTVDPLVARRLAMGTDENEYVNDLRGKNIGGFGFSYAIGMFVPYVAVKIMRSKGSRKAGFIGLFALLFIYSILTQYTMLLILEIIFSTIVFIVESKGVVTKIIISAIVIVILLSFTRIIGFLGNHIPLQELAYHFKMMHISLTTGEETNSRLLYLRSNFGLFRAHPFLGVNMLDSYNAYIVNHGHSTYVQMLSSHGIIGASAFFGMLIMLMKNTAAKLLPDKAVWIIMLHYFVLGIVNPNNSFEISLVAFFIIPLLEYYSMHKGEEELMYD